MTVGKVDGDPCARTVGAWGNRRRCPGTVTVQAVGVDETGRGYRFVGCADCGWSTREVLPEPDTMPLFDGDAA